MSDGVMDDRARLAQRLLSDIGEQLKRELPVQDTVPERLVRLLRDLEERSLLGKR